MSGRAEFRAQRSQSRISRRSMLQTTSTGFGMLAAAALLADEAAATTWFEAHVWPNDRHCPRCGNAETIEAHGDMPYWCQACRRYFSVRIGTALFGPRPPSA